MSGGEFSHSTAPSSGGSPPSTPSPSAGAAEGLADIVMLGRTPTSPDRPARRLRRLAELVEQSLLEARRARQRGLREGAGVEAQGNGDDAHEHGDAQAAADPFADAQRALHRGEDAAADQQGDGKRRRRARGIGQQQQRGLDVGAVQRRAGQDEPQDRPGAGRPQEAGGDAQQERRQDGGRAAAGAGQFRKTRARRDQRPGQPVGERREQQGEAQHGQDHDGDQAAIFVGLHRPAAADGGERRHEGEGRGHAQQHRQAALDEGLVGPGEDEGQHRQDARADDRQHAADIRQDEQDHGLQAARAVKAERDAVHAVAQAGRRRAVIEDMAEMAATLGAMDFLAHHVHRAVAVGRDGRVLQRRPEARPAGVAVELGLGGEQRELATGAGEGAGAVLLVERARIGALGALPPQHRILGGRQQGAPFRVGMRDLEALVGGDRPGKAVAIGDKHRRTGHAGGQDMTSFEHGGLLARWLGGNGWSVIFQFIRRSHHAQLTV